MGFSLSLLNEIKLKKNCVNLPYDCSISQAKKNNLPTNIIMDHTLEVLIIEDSQSDAELNAHYLGKMGYEISFQRVENSEEMKDALKSQKWNIILSDYSMPQFDVLSALAIYHASGLDIPFIVISGAIGEEKAVEMIKAGA
ncbi:MAG: response regulator, partial [Bacteroidetes bacterium]|nr:response regulator [Bacteroidota bacterium]